MRQEVEHRTYDRSAPPAAVTMVHSYRLPAQPGFSIVGLRVVFPPRGSTPPHRHGGASVAGHVVGGKVYNRMNDGPTHLLDAGESFFEAPGCHHVTSENASDTEDAVLIVNMVVDTDTVEKGGIPALVIIDEEYR